MRACIKAMRREPRLLRGLTWRSIGWLFAVAFAFALYSLPSVVVLYHVGLHAPLAQYALALFEWFVRYLVEFGPVLLAVVVADNLPLRGAVRALALAGAIVLGAQVHWPLRCLYEPQVEPGCAIFETDPWKSWRALSQDGVWIIGFSVPLALATFSRRRDLRVARALHSAQVDRIDVERKTLEADLQAMQARVEPAFLLAALRDAGELYARDIARGERMLDELIGYLRAALPDMRASGSTLARELRLARAYLAIVAMRADGRLRIAIDDDPPAGVRMPAMLVLPLLAAVVDVETCGGQGASSVALRVSIEDGFVLMRLVAGGPAVRDLEHAAAVPEIRRRLAALYDGRASLTVTSSTASSTSAFLALPYEAA